MFEWLWSWVLFLCPLGASLRISSRIFPARDWLMMLCCPGYQTWDPFSSLSAVTFKSISCHLASRVRNRYSAIRRPVQEPVVATFVRVTTRHHGHAHTGPAQILVRSQSNPVICPVQDLTRHECHAQSNPIRGPATAATWDVSPEISDWFCSFFTDLR